MHMWLAEHDGNITRYSNTRFRSLTVALVAVSPGTHVCFMVHYELHVLHGEIIVACL